MESALNFFEKAKRGQKRNKKYRRASQQQTEKKLSKVFRYNSAFFMP